MNIVVEKQPKCVAILRVEIPAEHVASERGRILRAYQSQAKVPGFRPGKAPAALIEKRHGEEIREELYGRLVREAFDQALEQEDLKVLDFGAPEDLSDTESGLSFHATLMLAPDFTLPEYKGIQVTVPPAEVPQSDVDAQIESMRERFAEFEDVTGRAAQTGDFAVLDYSTSIEGQELEAFLGKPAGFLGGREDFWVKLDEESFLPGFAAQLEGMNPGDQREIAITLPEDFPMTELRGREVKFHTTLKELKTATLPEFDDAFAARLGEGMTAEKVRDLIRENLQSQRKQRIDDLKVDQIVRHFNESVDFELPDDLVRAETQSQADGLVQRGVKAGMSEQELLEKQADIFDNASSQAVTNLRTNFILQEIARAEKITVSDSELVNHLAQIATNRNEPPRKFIRDLQRADRLPGIRSSILIGKTIDFLVAAASVEESADAELADDAS